MKRKMIAAALLLGVIAGAAGLEKSVVGELNQYGGRTVKYLLGPEDQYGDQIRQTLYFYDGNDELAEIRHEFTKEKAASFGFRSQSEMYAGGIVSEFRMELTEDAFKMRGIRWQIERVDADDVIYEFEYSDGERRAKSGGKSFVVNYPFYTLPYLEEVFFEDYEPNEKGDAYSFSAKFWKARTFVEFLSDPVPVTADDRKRVYMYLGHLGQEQHTDVYSHKVTVGYRGRQYLCYLQNPFVGYIHKGDQCLLTYQVMGVNRELMLLATEFNELE